MEQNQKVISKKKLAKRITAVSASLFVIFYVCYTVFSSTVDTVFTTLALNAELDSSIDAQVFIVRDERYIISDAPGCMVPVAEDGSRVSAGDAVSMVFRGENDAALYTEIQNTQKSIENYQSLASLSETAQTSLSKTNTEISSVLLEMTGAVGNGKYAQVGDYSNELLGRIIKRRLIMGDDLPLNEKVFELQLKLRNLQAQTLNAVSVKADRAGYYISTCDGYENVLSYDKVLTYTASDVLAAIKSEPAVIPENAIGKLVDSFEWYMLCVVESEYASELEGRKRVKIRFPDASTEELSATLVSTGLSQDGHGFVVLECNLMNSSISSLRSENAEIIIEEVSGLRVPSNAVREQDGQKGVLVRRSNLIRFCPFDILYTGENFVIVEPTGKDGSLMKLYDEIVIKGNELYDGKVIK